MLGIHIQGRLGNQMFQYAAMRGIQARLYPNEEIALSFGREGNLLRDLNVRPFRTDVPRPTLLQRFVAGCIGLLIKSRWKNDQIQHRRAVQHDAETRLQPLLNFFGLYQMQDGYCAFRKSRAKNKLVSGYLESEKYFAHIADEIKGELTPVYPPFPENAALYERMAETESVCVSVRRGDFLDESIKRYANVCGPDYFARALARMRELVPNAVWFVFSDDVEWVRGNIPFDGEVQFEQGNDPAWEKLRLMSRCKHFILSNSTFAWWAQYLGSHPGKIVIAPSRWRIDSERPDIYQENWVLIEA